jgi:hypothetical protein
VNRAQTAKLQNTGLARTRLLGVCDSEGTFDITSSETERFKTISAPARLFSLTPFSLNRPYGQLWGEGRISGGYMRLDNGGGKVKYIRYDKMNI